MICKQCQSQGLKSRVYPGPGMSTAMYCPAFYDEDGRYHNHDLNTHSTHFKCSNGHEWNENSVNTCWCGWSH